MIDGDSILVSLRTLRFLSGLCDTKVITKPVSQSAQGNAKGAMKNIYPHSLHSSNKSNAVRKSFVQSIKLTIANFFFSCNFFFSHQVINRNAQQSNDQSRPGKSRFKNDQQDTKTQSHQYVDDWQ